MAAPKAKVRLGFFPLADLPAPRGFQWRATSRTSLSWHLSAALAHSVGANHVAEKTRRQQQHSLTLELLSSLQRPPPHESSTKVHVLVLGLPGEEPVVHG